MSLLAEMETIVRDVGYVYDFFVLFLLVQRCVEQFDKRLNDDSEVFFFIIPTTINLRIKLNIIFIVQSLFVLNIRSVYPEKRLFTKVDQLFEIRYDNTSNGIGQRLASWENFGFESIVLMQNIICGH